MPCGKKMAPSPPSLEDDDNAALFSAVLSTLDISQLPLLASTVLRRIDSRFSSGGDNVTLKLPTVGEPIYGSYHVLFPLTFVDLDVRWLAKVPINGTPGKWDELSASALASEAYTMRLLRRESTIPLPTVVDFSSTTENVLRSPYIIMSFIPGVPLYEVWFGYRLNGGSISPETTHACRIRALEGIAAAMAQLGRFSFPTSGALLFGSNGMLSGIGPIRRIDNKAMLDRAFDDPNSEDNNPVYVSCPPSSDPKAYYTFMLDLHSMEKPYPAGVAMLLRQLISWIPEPLYGRTAEADHGHPFVLAHPDFDIQNFIVSEEGELQGIIDWDGIAAVPRSLGNERYPGWLTRDWDPLMYGYTESTNQGAEPDGLWEDSPASLARYRSVYADIMARHRLEKGCAESEALDPDLCRISLLTDNLAIAAEAPQCRNDILRKMLEEMWAAASAGAVNEAGDVGADRNGDAPDLTELAEMFAEDKVDAAVIQTLKNGFDALLSKRNL